MQFLARGLGLSTRQKLFFQGLVQIENARSREEREWCEVYLADLRPQLTDRVRIREIDEYLAISDWIHPALLALSDTEASFRDAGEAAAKFGEARTPLEVRAAIERLTALGLLRRDKNEPYRATCASMTTKDDVACRGVREYHRQSATLAAERIENQTVNERECQSLALAVPRTRIVLAKEMIRKFRSQFAAAMGSEHADTVYQLNLHFFRLTESPSERVAPRVYEGADSSPIPSGETHVLS